MARNRRCVRCGVHELCLLPPNHMVRRKSFCSNCETPEEEAAHWAALPFKADPFRPKMETPPMLFSGDDLDGIAKEPKVRRDDNTDEWLKLLMALAFLALVAWWTGILG